MPSFFRAHAAPTIAVLVAIIVALHCSNTIGVSAMPIMVLQDGNIMLPPKRSAELERIGDALSANASVLLHASLFHKIVSAALPALIEAVRNLTVPGESQKHFSFDTIKVSSFNIGSLAIGFAGPNEVIISLENLELAIPDTGFEVKDKILFVDLKCKGHFSVSMSKTNILVKFHAVEENGVLAFDNGVATVNFGSLNVEHKFDDFLCKIGQDIVQLFIGNIDSKIKDLVEKDIGPLATKALNAAFAKLAADSRIHIVAAPTATSNSIAIQLNLLPHDRLRAQPNVLLPAAVGGATEDAAIPVAVGRLSEFDNRDIEAWIDESSAHNLLEHFQEIGHLNFHAKVKANTTIFKTLLPGAFALCPDCQIELSNLFPTAPRPVFNGSAGIVVDNMHFIVNGVDAANGTTVQLFVLGINGTLLVQNISINGQLQNTIRFAVAMPVFAFSTISTNSGPIDTGLLTSVIDFLLQGLALPEFNKNFQGITIPLVDGITIDRVEMDFAGGRAIMGVDVKIPQLAERV